MKKKVYRMRHNLSNQIVIEKDPIAKELKGKAVKTIKNYKKKSDK